jgi:DNA polymerase
MENTPYAGEGGRLLARIVAAMALTPGDVYVSHVVKCRPPEGREPSAEEARRCMSSLEHEIQAVAPEVICALGDFAARMLLDRREPLEQLRGRFYERGGVRIMPTWHPDDMIDDPDKKRPAWEDIRKVMSSLDIT